jgi:hypothetical protein
MSPRPNLTEQDLHDARRALRERGEVDERVLAELRGVVAAMTRPGALPPSYSPYGSWNEEATEELYQDWLAGRLLAGGLQALLDRARTPRALRSMAERSLRQWMLNQRTRSQSQNLYTRTSELLRDRDEVFVCVRRARRQTNAWWALLGHEDAPEWSKSDEALVSVAYALGDFAFVPGRVDAERLAPGLKTPELLRFVEGLLRRSEARLTLGHIARAMQGRFPLDPIALDPVDTLEKSEQPSIPPVDEVVILAATVQAIIGELTGRQAAILLATRADATWDEMAAEHGCSPATISNEQRRIAAIVMRHAEDVAERDTLLRMTGAALYEGSASR